MFSLRSETSHAWVQTVLADFDAFLIDHAACERKASASGLSLVVRYPDRKVLVKEMIAFAQEELSHFGQVHALMEKRGLRFANDEKDPYVGAMLGLVRNGTEEKLLDRLLVNGIVEARGCERFGLVAKHHPEEEIRDFYETLFVSEAKHHTLFLKLSREYFDAQVVKQRYEQLLEQEAQVVAELPNRAALH